MKSCFLGFIASLHVVKILNKCLLNFSGLDSHEDKSFILRYNLIRLKLTITKKYQVLKMQVNYPLLCSNNKIIIIIFYYFTFLKRDGYAVILK